LFDDRIEDANLKRWRILARVADETGGRDSLQDNVAAAEEIGCGARSESRCAGRPYIGRKHLLTHSISTKRCPRPTLPMAAAAAAIGGSR
jgi:hypothetical protein